jgi:serine/threonine-protein kinase SRPK3
MTLQHVYHPEDDVEHFQRYCHGGFHPTYIGDEFADGKYRVIHKLGYGGYSTVWLARDRQENRYVALKIITAQASARNIEERIHLHLQNGDANHPGKAMIPSLLDQFSFDGPNGKHLCLVTEPAGCSIAESKANSPDFMFPLDSARSIAAQAIMGLAYLHSNGVCHGGRHPIVDFPQPSLSAADKVKTYIRATFSYALQTLTP